MTFGGLRFEKEDLMKKLLAVCAAAVLLLSLAACGKTDTDTITDSKADKPAAETAGVGTHHAEIDIQDWYPPRGDRHSGLRHYHRGAGRRRRPHYRAELYGSGQ